MYIRTITGNDHEVSVQTVLFSLSTFSSRTIWLHRHT